MKKIFSSILTLALVAITNVSIAQNLLWTDESYVPAIKIGKDQYISCSQKGWYLFQYVEEDKAKTGCTITKEYKFGDLKEEPVILSAQQLADIHVGTGLTAVGTLPETRVPYYVLVLFK